MGLGQHYEERFLPPWRLARLFDGFSRIDFVSARMLCAPERFGFPSMLKWPRALQPLARMSSNVVARLAPTWIYILRK
jgi:hypothetical protein